MAESHSSISAYFECPECVCDSLWLQELLLCMLYVGIIPLLNYFQVLIFSGCWLLLN